MNDGGQMDRSGRRAAAMRYLAARDFQPLEVQLALTRLARRYLEGQEGAGDVFATGPSCASDETRGGEAPDAGWM